MDDGRGSSEVPEGDTSLGTSTLEWQSAADHTICEVREAPQVPASNDQGVQPRLGNGIKRQRIIRGWVDDKPRLNKRDGKLYWPGHFKDGKKRIDRVIGPKSELSKGDAKKKLQDEIIPAYFADKEGVPALPSGQFKQKHTPTFEKAALNYLDLRSGNWKNSTLRDLTYIFRSHIIPKLGSFLVTDIVPSQIQLLFNAVAENGGGYRYKQKDTGEIVKRTGKGSESLVKKVVTHTRGVFDVCIDDDLLIKNPARAKTVKRPKHKKTSKWFLEIHEIEALLTVAARRSYRDYILLRVELVCGLRPEELFALRVEDIKDDRLHIDETVVLGELQEDEAKTEGSLAPVPMPIRLRRELTNYVKQEGIADIPQAFLFANDLGKPLNLANYRKKVLHKFGAEIGTKRALTFQVLRRTTGTHFQNYGEVKDTQALLRHADVETTLNIYQQTISANLSAAAAKWDESLSFAGGTVQ